MKNKFFKPTIFLALCLIIFSCSSNSDDCEPITCLNGGVFTDCECDCPVGYTGTDCSEQITPTNVTITKAIVKVFPNTDDGSNWDLAIPNAESIFPDMYITFENAVSTNLYTSDIFYEDAFSNGSTLFEFVPNLVLTNFSLHYFVSIWDYDSVDEDDFMTTYKFEAYLDGNGFPDTLTVVSQEHNILVDLELTYEW